MISAKHDYDSGSGLRKPGYFTFSFRGFVSEPREFLHIYNFVSDGFRVEHATQSGSYTAKECLRFSSVCMEKADGYLYRYNDYLAIDSEVLFNVMIPLALQRRSGDDPVNDCYFTFMDSSRKFIKSTLAPPWNGGALVANITNANHQYGWSSYECLSSAFIKASLSAGDSRDVPIVIDASPSSAQPATALTVPAVAPAEEPIGGLITPIPRSVLNAPSPDPTHDQLMDFEFGDLWNTPPGNSNDVPDLDSPYAWSEFD